MTLTELRKKWTEWRFEVQAVQDAYWVVATVKRASPESGCIDGPARQTRDAAIASLDLWMTIHIRRPKSREAAEGAKKDL